jgi:F0F1-type ATP synthase, alpha subunit
MTIKLREEDYISGETQPEKGALSAEENQSSLESGMLANVAPLAKPSKKSIEGEDFIGKAVVFPDGRKGTVIAQRPPIAFVICDFGNYDNGDHAEDKTISILGTRTTIPICNHLFGSVIDCYGNPISSSTPPTVDDKNTIHRAIFAPIPKVSDIALINSPLLTGSAMVDALAPIGKGQNMLLIGQDTGVGQRDLVVGAIKTQVKSANGGAKCVYAITSKDSNTRNQMLEKLKEAGVSEDIVVVCARDHPNVDGANAEAVDGAEAIAVAAAACSIGEGLALSTGMDTFVVVDDIDQHKVFWDWTTRVLIDIYGMNAVVKDDTNGGASSEMRGFFSSLIQRAAQFNEKNGGGV